MNQQKTIDVKDLVATLAVIAQDVKSELQTHNLDITDDTAVQIAIKIIDGMNIQGAYLPALLEALRGRTQNGLLKI